MSFSLIITFFTVMKVDEFHNILAAKAAYLFLWSRPPILLKQWKLLQLPIPQEICFLSAIWTILIRFLVFSESFSWVSLVYSSADCFLSPTWIMPAFHSLFPAVRPIPFLAVFFWNPVSRVVFIRVFYGFSCGFCFPLRWDFCCLLYTSDAADD